MNRRTTALLAVLVAAALTVLSACSSDDDAEGGSSNTSGPTSDPPSSAPSTTTTTGPPCPADPPTGDVERTLDVGGEQRTYRVHVPAGLTGRVPLVVTVHGLGSGAAQQLVYSGFPELADREGFVVAAPQARGNPAMWNFQAPANEPTSDGAFLTAMGEDIAATWCIDPQRRFASGISNGSAVTFALACAGDLGYAAYGGVAGAFYAEPCADAPPAPIIYFHGTADPLVPIEGGAAVRSSVKPVLDTMEAWAEHDGCSGVVDTEQISEHVVRRRWGSCSGDAAIEYYEIDGGGHTWPGADVDVERFGETNREISATELMWEFFERHPATDS
jgi:polyhydroxybutyrate depolymerase